MIANDRRNGTLLDLGRRSRGKKVGASAGRMKNLKYVLRAKR